MQRIKVERKILTKAFSLIVFIILPRKPDCQGVQRRRPLQNRSMSRVRIVLKGEW